MYVTPEKWQQIVHETQLLKSQICSEDGVAKDKKLFEQN